MRQNWRKVGRRRKNSGKSPTKSSFKKSKMLCFSPLLEHYDEIVRILEEGHNTDLVYLDFAKANKCEI